MATADQALKWVDRLYKRLTGRRRMIRHRYEYLDGKHPLVYATEEWKTFHAERYEGFSDNWCEVVASSAVDRLRIDGFRLGDSTDSASPQERQLWSDWQRNELTAQSNQGFLASSVATRSATLVWGDPDENPVVSWERPDQIEVAYDETGQPVAAIKAWVDRDAEREFLTLYLATEVWKFERGTSFATLRDKGVALPDGLDGWAPRQVPGELWPLPNPLNQVPIVEWLNRPRLGADPISDIDGTVAMQNAINAMWGYLFPAADHASMPARVVIGGEPPKVPILDENGQLVGTRPAKMEDLAKDRLLFLSGADKIGQYEAAKSEFFTSVITEAIGHIAAQTRTPGHYLLTTGTFANLNGDALTAAEVPLVQKCMNIQIHYNPSAKRTAALMAQVRSETGLAEEILAADGLRFVQWKDPAMHSLAQVADAATKDRAVGMSLRTVLERRYGFTEPEIDQEIERVRAEMADPILQKLMEGTQRGSGSQDGNDANNSDGPPSSE